MRFMDRGSLNRLRPETAPVALGRLPADPGEPRDAGGIAAAYFLAAAVVGVSLGASWGAHLLARIGALHSFTAVSVHEINAHGHAQIFGWVGLFVMGFAYHFLPPWNSAPRPSRVLAYLSLALMLCGIAMRSILEPYAHESVALRYVAAGGSCAELAAIGMFTAAIVTVFRRSRERFEPCDYYIGAALAWFVVQAVWDAIYFLMTSGATSREELLRVIAAWQAPLREVQIHGFAMLMLLGISLRLFPQFYGTLPAAPRRSVAWLTAINAAILGMIAGFVMMNAAGHRWAALWYSAVLLLGAGVIAVVAQLRIFGTVRSRDRGIKFFRSAYAWLLLSIIMLVFLPGYQFGLLKWLAPESRASQLGFSHAYYGAIRHAVAVGFVSQMIMVIPAKALSGLRGLNEARLTPLWAPFVLLNLGCLLRVSVQTLSDLRPAAFAWIGISGVLEVAALVLWGAHIARMICHRMPVGASPPAEKVADGDLAAQPAEYNAIQR